MNKTLMKIIRCELIGPAIVAFVSLLSVILTLDAAGDYPSLFEGPGVTLDESFNVQMGVYQWNALCEYNVALLHLDSVREVFGPESNYNPDHPPLGRIWLGTWHDLTRWMFPPVDHPSPFVTDCARMGSAAAFAITVFLIGMFATKWYGGVPGIVAAAALVLMPRSFAHAHLAALETFMNLMFVATILTVAHWWTKPRNNSQTVNNSSGLFQTSCVSWPIAVATGVLFGLAMLSKIQAVLIPPIVGLWALFHWRTKAIAPLAILGSVGLLVFFVGWPWLWLDPLTNLREYFARSTSRTVLNCFYGGQTWADKHVPWHYPFVMFAVTVPIGLQALGVVSVTRLKRQPREQLLALATVLPLVLFALPGVAVYDGERLFSVSYPIWAVLIGRGAMVVIQLSNLQRERGRMAKDRVDSSRTETSSLADTSESFGELPSPATTRQRMVVGAFLLSQSIGVITMHPCQLSYYNLLVGGIAGADRLGFERTYWGDSVTRSTLANLCTSAEEETTVVVAPVLHQFQLQELIAQSPILRRSRLRLVSSGDREATGLESKVARLIFCRKADLPTKEIEVEAVGPELGEVCQGVRLSSVRTK